MRRIFSTYRTGPVAIAAALTALITALLVASASAGAADPEPPAVAACTVGQPSDDGANLHVPIDCLIPKPSPVVVTEVSPSPSPYPSPSPVVTTVTVSASPSPSSSPTASASPSPTPTATQTSTAGCPAYPAMPDEKCTGYARTGVTLKTCALRITAPGTYDGCRFSGVVVVASTGVTITRSLIQGHVEGASGADLRGAVLQDVQIIGQGNDGSAAIGNNNYTCRRCDISGGLRGFSIGSNVLIEDSYTHDFWVQPASQRGANSVHQTGASTHGGSNIVVRHSTIRCNSDAYACSSAMSLYSEDSPGIKDVLIEQSFFTTDAGYGLMFASLVSGKPYGITNTRVLNCVFGKSEYGPVANFPSGQAGNVWSGNRLANGTAI